MPEYNIPKLVKMVEDGEINIPEFQREFVWSNNQIRDLAESIYKGYPIGLLVLFEVPSELKSQPKERFWVLDGQQRLLSLTVIMRGKVNAIKDGQKKTVKVDIWFDPANEKFELRRPREGENWIKLTELLQIQSRFGLEKMLRERGFNTEEQERISALWGTFKNDYKVLVHELSGNLDLDDLGNIFVRTNFAGTRVRGTDVYSTMIAIVREDLVKELRDFCARLHMEVDYGILIRTFVAFLTDGKVKLASRVLEQANRLREILKGKETQLKSTMREVEIRTQQSIKILQNAGIGSLPSENVIPVMSYYLHKRGTLSPEEEEELFKWFILASFFGRYTASAETRLDEDLTLIKKGGNYRDLIKNIEQREGDLKERILAYIDEGRCDKLLLYALLKQSNARDFLSNEPLTQMNSTLHHIFPKKHLVESKYETLINDVGNITLLTPSSNSRLLDELPENYLQRVPPETLKAHYIPEEREIWKLEKIEEFIKRRKENFKRAVEDFFKTI
jgi:hypothetical protein